MDKLRLDLGVAVTEDYALTNLADAPETQINFVRIKPGKALCAHRSNSNVRLIILSGEIAIDLDGKIETVHRGEIAYVPFDTQMQIRNDGSDQAEFVVIKAPHPNQMPAT